MSDEQVVYENKPKPLKDYKSQIWYDDFNNINKLFQLAAILGLKNITIYGNKDDENDIAIVKTNNKGDGLIIENCFLKLELVDDSNTFVTKRGNEKTYFKRGDSNVL